MPVGRGRRQLNITVDDDLYGRLEMVALVDGSRASTLAREAVELLVAERLADPDWRARRDELRRRLDGLGTSD